MPMLSRRFMPPEYFLVTSPARSVRPVTVSTSAQRRFALAVGMP
jgi:hypothetical protein